MKNCLKFIFLIIIYSNAIISFPAADSENINPTSGYISTRLQTHESSDRIIKLKCIKADPLDAPTPIETNYEIYDQNDNHIGEISLHYWSKGGCYKKEDTGRYKTRPTLRIEWISIFKPYQKTGHATRSLKTLFSVLQQHSHFPVNTIIGLEYDLTHSNSSFLRGFYRQFGFREKPELSYEGHFKPENFPVLTAQLAKIHNL